MEILAKRFQHPQERTETGQMFLKQERRSSFSAPTEMLNCPSSPGLVPFPDAPQGSHRHHEVSGGLSNSSFICENRVIHGVPYDNHIEQGGNIN